MAIDKTKSIIRIRDLHKSYGDTEVLKGIDMDVYKGEVVVILGPSGSGKSTMLRCVNRLEEPTSGHIYFEDTEITDKKTNINEVRKHVGMVFQNFNLFPHLTAKKNVMIAQEKVLKRSKEEAERIAIEQLQRVGLGDRMDHYPDGLSGGQQQRVAIARALAMNPHVMLFDEATSALDPELVRGVLDACDGRSVFKGGVDGGQARFSRAYNDDVVLFRFGEVYDRFGCLQESRAGRCGGFGFLRGCFGLAASGEASDGKCAYSGNSGCLKEVAARYAKLFFRHYSLLAVGRGAADLEFPRCLRWRPSSCRWTGLCALEGFAASTDEAK